MNTDGGMGITVHDFPGKRAGMGIARRRFCMGLIGGGLAMGALGIPAVRRMFHPLVVRLRGAKTVEQRVMEFGEAEQRIRERFLNAGVAFPPMSVVLVGLKEERRVEVYAGAKGEMCFVAAYPILAASGAPGPKLREGDRQVPEGIYPVESLNPNSRFHAALRVGYPNAYDREMASRDGRTELGGDIMIHGGSASIGCLAMGDPAAEELFVLAARAGIENMTVVLSPMDLRSKAMPVDLQAGWRAMLYAAIESELAKLSREPGN